MRKLSFTIAASISTVAVSLCVLHTTAQAETAKVTASALRMRTGPSSRYRTKATFKRGTEVTLLSTAKSPWWKVQVGNTVGYMHSHYLHKLEKVKRTGLTGALGEEPTTDSTPSASDTATNAAAAAAKPETARVDASRLKLRKGPSSRTPALTSLPRGSKVDVLDKGSGNWWKVRTPDGEEGYMYKDYLGSTDDVIADPIRADDPAPNSGTVVTQPGDPVVTLGRHARVSPRAINILKQLLRESGNRRATITSGRRTPTDQARAMYQLLRNNGSAYGRRLYGWGGDQVIRTYDLARAAGKSAAGIQSAMVVTIKQVGPSRVSKHCRATGDVFDVAPSSIARKSAFVAALKRARSRGTISKLILPPSDPAYHLELN